MIWCWRPLAGAAGSCFRTTEAIDFLGLGVVHAGNSWCLELVDGDDAGYGVSKTLWLILQGFLFLLQCSCSGSCSCSCSWCCCSCFASSSGPTRFVTGRGGSCCCLRRLVAAATFSRRLRIHAEGRRRTCTKKPNNS